MNIHPNRHRILAVDDDPNTLHLLAQCLGEDLDILVATSGRDALRLAHSHPSPQLVLLDIMLPDMDGYEVCKRLKEDELTRHIPILFVTAQDGLGSEESGLALGAVDYITKPFYPPIVRARVRNHLARVHAEQEARLLADQLHSITHTVMDPIIGINAMGSINFWNPAATATFGYSEDEARGQILYDLIAPSSLREQQVAQFADFLAVRDGSLIGNTFETMALHKSGEAFPVEVSLTAYSRRDGEVQAVGIVRDIRERKAHEAALIAAKTEAEEANSARARFLSLMSHEMRSPLQGIIGTVELLHDEPLSDQQKRFAEAILSSSHSLHRLISDILDFSKIDAGKLELAPFDFDLFQSVEEWMRGMAVQAASKDLDFVIELSTQLPQNWHGDWHRIRQVLTNLCSNAIKFTHTGLVKVSFSSQASQDDDEPLLIIHVQDSGIGIAKEALPLLFSDFVQADASTSRYYGGTGLGLAISRQIAQLMGGDISVSSIPSIGSCFAVSIPMRRLSPPPPKPFVASDAPVVIMGLHPDREEHLCAWLKTWDIPVVRYKPSSAASADLDWLGSGAPKNAALAIVGRKLLAHFPGDKSGTANIAWPASWGPRVVLAPLGTLVNDDLLRSWGCSHALHEPFLPLRLAEVYTQLVGSMQDVPPSQVLGLTPSLSDRSVNHEVIPGENDDAPRILVVDDNAVGQMVIKCLLAKVGCVCDDAKNGFEALDALRSQRYDAVFMDCQMPGMDGYEATRNWRQHEKDSGTLRRTPIIAVTGNSLDTEISSCLSAGMDEVLLKPCSFDDLIECLEQHVSRFSR